MDKIAVTGIGVVAPSGIGRRQFWANVKAGRSFVKEITRFEASKYPAHIAGQIDDLEKYSHVSERLLKKIDAFSHMALIAAELALKDAGIDIKNEDPNLVGIFLGNAIGGWLYAETELRGKLAKAALLEHDRNQQLMQEAARTHAEGGDVTPVMGQLTTSTDLDGVSIKIVWKATIQDVTLMPDEYVIRLPDNKKLKEYAASFEGAEPTAVPGVIFERDATTRVRGN